MKLNLQPVTAERLQKLVGSSTYDFLGFLLDLKTCTLTDRFNGDYSGKVGEWKTMLLSVLLSHYAESKPTPTTGELIKFKDLPGGTAYEGAFVELAINPIAKYFGQDPVDLMQAAELLGGKPLTLGDVSAEIPSLKGIPLTYILWGAEEFPASGSILYDKSASCYLPTEDLAVLGEVTTARLLEAKISLT